jgi:hypothetical protein
MGVLFLFVQAEEAQRNLEESCHHVSWSRRGFQDHRIHQFKMTHARANIRCL